ncbi:MAG: tRNA lysidine(34) synthetase TilS [Anaerolineae bacterium]|nr:tRNA lysidine(34) synthetase TilS [Anaerolineae bacterium]
MLAETIRQIIQKFGLIPPEAMVVIGVSGGADSLALLHLLHRLSFRMNFHIHAATLDHQLRGAESADDARFIAAWCQAHGIAITTGAADVRSLAANEGLSIEMAARQARYEFLARTAREQHAKRIAVGHHADDQAETVLLHLLRGSGGRGLAGMAMQSPVPGHPDLLLIRPLLNITRAEIEGYCSDHGLSPRHDSSNLDTHYLRNRLRHETIPHLEQINARVRQVLAQQAEIAAVEDDYLNGEVRRLAAQFVNRSPGRAGVDRAAFQELHPALTRRLLITIARELVPDAELDYAHIVAAIEIALRGKHGAVALLGSNLQLRIEYGHILIETTTAAEVEIDGPLLSPGDSLPIDLAGVTAVGTWELCTSGTPFPEPENTLRLVLPREAHLTLRTRQAGDRFAPLGMNGHTQTVSRWMGNRKIPLALRDRLPLLCVGNSVAAIRVGKQWSVSEHYATDGIDKYVVYFRFRHSS